MFKLQFTKFLDVKNPLGIKQKDDVESKFYSIGVDIYMPRPTAVFISELIRNNPHLSLSSLDKVTGEFKLVNKLQEVIFQYVGGEYSFWNKIQIPAGIGLLIPEDYYVDLRSKSGNFKYDYTSIMGLIDGDYTYSMGVQIVPLTKGSIIKLKPDEKFAQIILKKSYPIAEMIEIPLKEWDSNPEVIERRKTRQGGFGHTGKFDK